MSLSSARKRLVIITVFLLCAVIAFAKFGLTSRAKSALSMLLPPSLITATKVDSISTDTDGDGRADPGDTIQYDVTVTNGAPGDATGVKFTDTIDANETIVANSLQASPVAVNDGYTDPGGPLNI